jgi:hypothetical protein
MNTETKGKAIVNFEKIIDEVYQSGVTDGEKQGRENRLAEFEQSMETKFEKRNANFAVEKFSDCKTLEDFTSVFNEIRNRSYNFM